MNADILKSIKNAIKLLMDGVHKLHVCFIGTLYWLVKSRHCDQARTQSSFALSHYQDGCSWDALGAMYSQTASISVTSSTPDVLLIHLGGNNLGYTKGTDWTREMKIDLEHIIPAAD